MGWLQLVGPLKLQVSFAKEAYKRDDILQKKPMIFRSQLIVATPYQGCQFSLSSLWMLWDSFKSVNTLSLSSLSILWALTHFTVLIELTRVFTDLTPVSENIDILDRGVIVVSVVFGEGEVCIAYTSILVNVWDPKHVLKYLYEYCSVD